jgi:uncharacterized protein
MWGGILVVRDDRFEWDDAKADSNRRKHGVTFVQATETFDDPHGFDEWDDDPDEERWHRIGMTRSGVLIVSHTDRGNRIRIISARRANTHEQDRYQRQTHSQG